MSSTIRLTKGEHRGDLVQLRHWQGDVYCDALRLDAGGRRMYRTYELWVPRKNSKSLIGAGFALDGLFDEPGAEVYSCAGEKDQAKIVFGEVRQAVEMSPDLSKLLRVYRDAIEYPPLGSVYKALSRESRLKEGLNPSRTIFDELHVQRDDDLWNVMNQGSDTREQPITIVISTFGVMTYSNGEPTIAKRQYDYAKKVISGEVDDPAFGARIYETTLRPKTKNYPGDDYRDPKHWYGANPALGDFLLVENMQTRVQQLPEADVKTKRLNIWVTTAATWLPDGKWKAIARPRRKAIPGERAIVQFDGAFSNDSTAITAWLLGGDKPHLTLLALWEKPDGARDWHVPVGEVKALLPALFRREETQLGGESAGRTLQLRWDLDIPYVVFDPARWLEVFRSLEEEGVPVIEYPNSADRMVPATTLFYSDVISKAFTHDGHPALARHVGNAVTKLTSRGVMLDKRNAKAHIDALVCSVCGYDVATQREAVAPDVLDTIY